jgi:hypothetical protein
MGVSVKMTSDFKSSIRIPLFLLCCLTFGAMTPHAIAEFIRLRPLGSPPSGSLVSRIYNGGISDDGTVVVGTTTVPWIDEFNHEDRVFRWTRQSGMVAIDETGSSVTTTNLAMSADGSTIVWGAYGGAGTPNHFTRVWSRQNGVQTLPVEVDFLNNDRPSVNISADGGVVVGGNRRVKRWTDAGGLENLSIATTNKLKTEVSDDGKAIAIVNEVGNGNERPVRWTAENGVISLGSVGDHNEYRVNGMSADGSVIVGVSRVAADRALPSLPTSLWRWTSDARLVVLDEGTPDTSYFGPSTYADRNVSTDGRVIAGGRFRNGRHEAYRWTEEGGFVVLSATASPNGTNVFDMTPDGKWVVGLTDGFGAWLWSEPTGTRLLTDILIEQGDGPNIQGWTKGAGFRISADGRAIAGTWINPDGFDEAFVAYLDPQSFNGDFNGNGQLDAGDLDAMAVGMMNNDARFDLDRDGDVDVQDRLIWINDKKRTWMGDSNLDGEFNTSDLVAVFTASKYETSDEAGWAAGDWNGDRRFNTSDMVFAFTQGGYERGPRAASPVPEPSSWLLIVLGGVACCAFRARRKDAPGVSRLGVVLFASRNRTTVEDRRPRREPVGSSPARS